MAGRRRLGALDDADLSDQNAIGAFLGYVCDARYGWAAECEQHVGEVPRQICHDGNRAVHVADYEGRPGRRPLSRGELQRLFDTIDDAVERAGRSGRKGWLTAFRDATLFKTIYGWGLRRTEAAMLDVVDFSSNPAAPSLGGLGVCHVRFGKAQRGSPPRRRTVATVMPWPPRRWASTWPRSVLATASRTRRRCG